MTTHRVAGAAILVLAILVCLPTFHSATGLHGLGGAVDAFDQGVRVPETTIGGACIFAAIVVLAIVSRGRFISGATPPGTFARCGTPPGADRPRVHRMCARAAGPRNADDDELAPAQPIGFKPTPRIAVNSHGAGGSVIRNLTRREGASNVDQA